MNNRPVSVTAAVLLVLPQFVIAIAATVAVNIIGLILAVAILVLLLLPTSRHYYQQAS